MRSELFEVDLDRHTHCCVQFLPPHISVLEAFEVDYENLRKAPHSHLLSEVILLLALFTLVPTFIHHLITYEFA